MRLTDGVSIPKAPHPMLECEKSPEEMIARPRGEGHMKRIDFEAHFHTEEYLEAMYRNTRYPRFAKGQQANSTRLWYNDEVGQPYGDLLLKDLLNVGEERLARMTSAA